VDDLYVKKLEKDAEDNEKLLSKLAELVDEGIYVSSARGAKKIFIEMGMNLGMHMEDVLDNDSYDDDLQWDERDDDDGDWD